MPEPVAPSATDPQGQAEPKNNGVSDAEAQLRRELEKAQMRANQLQNEAEARDKAEAEARRKQLEEQEEYKTLYEKTEAELRDIREKADADTRRKALADASQDVLKDYPTEVQEIAKTAGIGLSDDSEAGRTSLKVKLDAIKERVRPVSTPSPSNPYNPAPASSDRKAVIEHDPEIGGSRMAYESAKGNLRPALDYIGGLSAIQEMKRQAGYQQK